MRLGCGCFLLAVVLVVTTVALTWGIWQSFQPADVSPVRVTAADAQRAQQKLYAAASRARGAEPITLTETELNAFLARNVAHVGDIALSDFRVRLPRRGEIEVAARTELGSLLQESPLASARGMLPANWLRWPLWVHLTTTPRVERTDGRRTQLRLEVQGFRLGRQRLPAFATRLLLDASVTRLLRVPLPEGVGAVSAEPGRVVIRFDA